MWKIQYPSLRESLLEQLRVQNGCREIIVLSDEKAFARLDKYHVPESSEYNGTDKVEKIILNIT